jgi:ubiquinone/menaquinone biosynthesis C-methylase UbiE
MTITIDETKLHQLLGQIVSDFGATMFAALTRIGDKLGLYKALAGTEPLSPAELAARTGTVERYVREWLNANAAGGYVTYHPESGRYSLAPEQALVLAMEGGPAFMLGAFEMALAAGRIEPRLTEAFVSGEGVGWHEHEHQLFHGIERFFRSGYIANLTASWIPALDGVEARLVTGASVADIGCGHGASTILMAQTYPNSHFVGFDYHAESIAAAQARAAEAGVAERVRFEIATAQAFPGRGFDLVTIFDALHDMGDPVGAASQVRASLKPDGVWLIVEPYAEDRVEANLHPIGRAYYSGSTLMCTPNALDQGGSMALGAQAGEARLREVLSKAGFTRIRRAAQTPFNLILEARP